MGTLIDKAQEQRNGIMRGFALRIRRANDRLKKSGSTSRFMYEDDGIHIISDIDWESYDKAYYRARKGFIQQGKTDFDLKEALEDWEE